MPHSALSNVQESSAGQNLAGSYEKTSGETMSDGKILTAEIIFIKESLESGEGIETKINKSPLAQESSSQASTSLGGQSENTLKHSGTASMETTANKHQSLSQQWGHDSAGHVEPYKIKSSYKSLAAIPTNTLLLDQQIIDEQVQSENILERGYQSHEDTHAEMCSPAQLRQQSEELYATIDEILADSNPQNKTATKVLVTDGSLRNKSAKSLGRETKYASLSSMHPSGSVEKRLMDSKKTNPGIVRPTMTIPRLSKEDGGYRHCPFRETDVYRSLKGNPNPCKEESVGLEDTRGNGHTSRKHQVLQKERTFQRSPFTVCELQIIEPEGQLAHFEDDASTSLCSEAHGTHI